MPRYGREFYPRYDHGYRPRPGYGPDYYGGGYGMYRDEQFPAWGGHPQGGGYARAPRYGEQERFARRPSGRWDAGEPWGGTGDVDRVQVAEIMTRNPEGVTPDTTLVEVARRMRDLDVGIIPVIDSEEGGRLQGVITDRDIAVRAAAEGKDMNEARVADFMSRDVATVGESDHVREVLSIMKRERVRRVPVTDPEGRLVGIVAQADLAVTYAGLDLQRETEVEEVIEKISEPARPRWRGEPADRTAVRRSGASREMMARGAAGDRQPRPRGPEPGTGRGYDRGWW